ncbi:hypothetical protein GLOTRDRAFT_127440 [Gloeophyllum trabeum ATCC 11539]|uniref:Uncharacterized protein n=1 Tax=Gloeophyllum trabeum (strain ATCC 11539 / FP-39264 / Madison 617) TaxID=670483 RepID=S7QCJ3_GLOTA|nr:uncharacterized protein GLOTRDRAFT_127440 [Gloeophyllum trabeum ATCC 11539]EPQ57062.1 hypothetical protein GLOTRDRAFT_127440 [Gloeophyllum trabeum ATCC 11539]
MASVWLDIYQNEVLRTGSASFGVYVELAVVRAASGNARRDASERDLESIVDSANNAQTNGAYKPFTPARSPSSRTTSTDAFCDIISNVVGHPPASIGTMDHLVTPSPTAPAPAGIPAYLIILLVLLILSIFGSIVLGILFCYVFKRRSPRNTEPILPAPVAAGTAAVEPVKELEPAPVSPDAFVPADGPPTPDSKASIREEPRSNTDGPAAKASNDAPDDHFENAPLECDLASSHLIQDAQVKNSSQTFYLPGPPTDPFDAVTYEQMYNYRYDGPDPLQSKLFRKLPNDRKFDYIMAKNLMKKPRHASVQRFMDHREEFQYMHLDPAVQALSITGIDLPCLAQGSTNSSLAGPSRTSQPSDVADVPSLPTFTFESEASVPVSQMLDVPSNSREPSTPAEVVYSSSSAIPVALGDPVDESVGTVDAVSVQPEPALAIDFQQTDSKSVECELSGGYVVSKPEVEVVPTPAAVDDVAPVEDVKTSESSEESSNISSDSDLAHAQGTSVSSVSEVTDDKVVGFAEAVPTTTEIDVEGVVGVWVKPEGIEELDDKEAAPSDSDDEESATLAMVESSKLEASPCVNKPALSGLMIDFGNVSSLFAERAKPIGTVEPSNVSHIELGLLGSPFQMQSPTTYDAAKGKPDPMETPALPPMVATWCQSPPVHLDDTLTGDAHGNSLGVAEVNASYAESITLTSEQPPMSPPKPSVWKGKAKEVDSVVDTPPLSLPLHDYLGTPSAVQGHPAVTATLSSQEILTSADSVGSLEYTTDPREQQLRAEVSVLSSPVSRSTPRTRTRTTSSHGSPRYVPYRPAAPTPDAGVQEYRRSIVPCSPVSVSGSSRRLLPVDFKGTPASVESWVSPSGSRCSLSPVAGPSCSRRRPSSSAFVRPAPPTPSRMRSVITSTPTSTSRRSSRHSLAFSIRRKGKYRDSLPATRPLRLNPGSTPSASPKALPPQLERIVLTSPSDLRPRSEIGALMANIMGAWDSLESSPSVCGSRRRELRRASSVMEFPECSPPARPCAPSPASSRSYRSPRYLPTMLSPTFSPSPSAGITSPPAGRPSAPSPASTVSERSPRYLPAMCSSSSPPVPSVCTPSSLGCSGQRSPGFAAIPLARNLEWIRPDRPPHWGQLASPSGSDSRPTSVSLRPESVQSIDNQLFFRYYAKRRPDKAWPVEAYMYGFLLERAARGERVLPDYSGEDTKLVLTGNGHLSAKVRAEAKRAELKELEDGRRAVRYHARNMARKFGLLEGTTDIHPDEIGRIADYDEELDLDDLSDDSSNESADSGHEYQPDRAIQMLTTKDTHDGSESEEAANDAFNMGLNYSLNVYNPAWDPPDHPDPRVRKRLLPFWRRGLVMIEDETVSHDFDRVPTLPT